MREVTNYYYQELNMGYQYKPYRHQMVNKGVL